jgi:hypothetical protein
MPWGAGDPGNFYTGNNGGAVMFWNWSSNSILASYGPVAETFFGNALASTDLNGDGQDVRGGGDDDDDDEEEEEEDDDQAEH